MNPLGSRFDRVELLMVYKCQIALVEHEKALSFGSVEEYLHEVKLYKIDAKVFFREILVRDKREICSNEDMLQQTAPEGNGGHHPGEYCRGSRRNLTAEHNPTSKLLQNGFLKVPGTLQFKDTRDAYPAHCRHFN